MTLTSRIGMKNCQALWSGPFLLLVTLLLSCCTYSFSGLSSEIHSVAVPVFGNKTARYGVEEVLTRKVIDAFIADNRLKVVERGMAGSVILGEVVGFSREPFSYDEKEEVRQYRVAIALQVSYQSLPEEEAVWEARIDEWGTYSALTGTEEDGIEEAASKLAEEVVRRTLERW